MSSSSRPGPSANPSRASPRSDRAPQARSPQRPSPGPPIQRAGSTEGVACPPSTTDGQNLSSASTVRSRGGLMTRQAALSAERVDDGMHRAWPTGALASDPAVRPPHFMKRPSALEGLVGRLPWGTSEMAGSPTWQTSNIRLGRPVQMSAPVRWTPGRTERARLRERLVLRTHRVDTARARRSRQPRSLSVERALPGWRSRPPPPPRHDETRCGGSWMSAYEMLGAMGHMTPPVLPIRRRQVHGQAAR